MSYHGLGRDGCPTGYEPVEDGCSRIQSPPPPDFAPLTTVPAWVPFAIMAAVGAVAILSLSSR